MAFVTYPVSQSSVSGSIGAALGNLITNSTRAPLSNLTDNGDGTYTTTAPINANKALWLDFDGVLQTTGKDYTVSGSTISVTGYVASLSPIEVTVKFYAA